VGPAVTRGVIAIPMAGQDPPYGFTAPWDLKVGRKVSGTVSTSRAQRNLSPENHFSYGARARGPLIPGPRSC
jgi:hypothetical protein